MIRRLAALVTMAWFLGFVWFTVDLPGPLETAAGDAAIVPTGAAGRIEHGIALLQESKVKALLVTGVADEVSSEAFASEFAVPDRLMQCCVILGYSATTTRGNATETAAWVKARNLESIRLVTTDWHMRRAYWELQRSLPEDVRIYRDAVPSEPSLRILFLEYHKMLAVWVASLWRG